MKRIEIGAGHAPRSFFWNVLQMQFQFAIRQIVFFAVFTVRFSACVVCLFFRMCQCPVDCVFIVIITIARPLESMCGSLSANSAGVCIAPVGTVTKAIDTDQHGNSNSDNDQNRYQLVLDPIFLGHRHRYRNDPHHRKQNSRSPKNIANGQGNWYFRERLQARKL